MTHDTSRYAIYFAPTAESALGEFGNGVLGRDAIRDIETAILPGLAKHFTDWRSHTTAAAHYGFHATLKPPFALATGVEASWLLEDVLSLAKSLAPLRIGHMKVSSIGKFIALVPVAPPTQLRNLAAHIVRSLDPLRAPLSEADRARRRPETLTPQQMEYLDQWGYPYVFDEFRFHMTLFGLLSDEKREEAAHVLRALYLPYDQPVVIKDICIFAQLNRTASFKLVERVRLGG